MEKVGIQVGKRSQDWKGNMVHAAEQSHSGNMVKVDWSIDESNMTQVGEQDDDGNTFLSGSGKHVESDVFDLTCNPYFDVLNGKTRLLLFIYSFMFHLTIVQSYM